MSAGRVAWIVFFAGHAALIVANGRPSADSPAGVLLGATHLAVGILALLVLGRACALRALPDAGRAEAALGVVVSGAAAWVAAGQALGAVGALRFEAAFLLLDAAGIVGALAAPPSPPRPPADLAPLRWPALFLGAVLLRFSLPWASGGLDRLIEWPDDPDSLTGYHYIPLRVVQTASLEIPYAWVGSSNWHHPIGWSVIGALPRLACEGTDLFALWTLPPAIPLVLLALYVAARRHGASAWSALAACGVLACERFLFLREAWGIARTDPWALLSFLALFAFLPGRSVSEGPGRALLAGAALGISVCAKPDTILYGAVLLAIAVLLPARAPRRLFTLCSVAVAVGGFPYLRNLVSTGNPLWPYPLKILGWTLLPGVDERLLWYYRGSVLQILTNGFFFTQSATVLLLGGWLLFAASVLRRPRRFEIVLAAVPLFLVGAFLMHPLSFARRLIFPPAASAVPFALLLDRIDARPHVDSLLDRAAGLVGLRSPISIHLPRRLVGPAALLLLIGTVASIPALEARRRAGWYDRLEEIAALPDVRDVGPLWIAAARATGDRAETIALFAVPVMYPFAGPYVRNPVVYPIRRGAEARISWDWGDPLDDPFLPIETETLGARLDALGARLVAAGRGTPEEAWLLAAEAETVAATPAGTLFRRW